MQNAKTFRLFISSTFDDFKEERQVLHEKVFPEIENYLKNNHKNYTFQAIDLRWGISTEAQLDQKTLDICLDEVEACKDYPHPNFLVMSGNRYGYVPLPYMIEESEFKSICEYIEKHNEKIVIKYDSELNSQKEVKSQKESIKITPLDLLKSWYVLDKNQIYLTDKNTSTAYILQVREKDYKIYVNWKAEEDALRDILQEAANHIFKSNNKEDEEYKKYFRSATEAEVDKGIINEYTFGFIREIINLDEHKNNVCNKQNPAYTFIDKNQEKAKKFKKKLVDELGSKNILDTEECIEIQKYDNLIKACVELTNDTRKVFLDNTYLDNFSDFMIDRLKYAIEVHMDGVTGLTREQEQEQKQKIEKDSHKKFKDERSSIFVGREELLERIFVYINIDRSNTPLVIYGKSGMGKSALMAESINRVKNKNKNIVYRFVGASADSSNIRSLLISIMDELGDDKYIDSVKEYATNRKKFYAQVRDILENKINKKVTIYIDAIDQLRSYNDLQWLPETLNINLQMIFSVLKDGDYSDDSEYYRSLFEKYSGNFINISRFSLKGSAEDFLKRLLKEKKRELNETQIKSVLDSFKESNYSPLYLKIAIEEIKNWKNDDNTRELKNNVKDIINGYIDNLRQSIGVIVVDKVLAYIHLSKNGLSESELLDILSEDLNDDVDFQKSILNEFHEPIKKKNPRRCNKEEYVLPMAIWSRLHTLLKPFLVEKNIDGHILIKYFHRQFTTVIEERYKDKKEQFHQKLANYFYSLQNKEKQWDKRYYNLHMLDEVPYQLFHAGDSKGLKKILFDLEFSGSIYDHSKQEGFRNILEQSSSLDDMNDEIYPWESFYREKEHRIIKVNEEHWKPHQTLFQLAYEDGDDSPLSESASNLLEQNKIFFRWMRNKKPPISFMRTGLVRVLKSHKCPVVGAIILNEREILSYAVDGSICIWDIHGELKIIIKENFSIAGVRIIDNIIISYPRKGVFNKNIYIRNIDNKLTIIEKYQIKGSLVDVLILKNNIVIISTDNKISRCELVSLSATLLDEIFFKEWDIIIGVNIFNFNEISVTTSEGNVYILEIVNNKLNIKYTHNSAKGIIDGEVPIASSELLIYTEDGGMRMIDFKTESFLDFINNDLYHHVAHKKMIKKVELVGTKVVSCSYDGKLCIWKKDGQLLKCYTGHESINFEVLDGRSILAYSDEKIFFIEDIIEIDQINEQDINMKDVRGVFVLSYTEVIVYSSSGYAILVNLNNGNIFEIMYHDDSINGILNLRNYKLLSYSSDGTLKIWKMKDQKKKNIFISNINQIRLLEDGRIQVYKSDGTLLLYSNSGEVIAQCKINDIKKVSLLNNGTFHYTNKDLEKSIWNGMNNSHIYDIENPDTPEKSVPELQKALLPECLRENFTVNYNFRENEYVLYEEKAKLNWYLKMSKDGKKYVGYSNNNNEASLCLIDISNVKKLSFDVIPLKRLQYESVLGIEYMNDNQVVIYTAKKGMLFFEISTKTFTKENRTLIIDDQYGNIEKVKVLNENKIIFYTNKEFIGIFKPDIEAWVKPKYIKKHIGSIIDLFIIDENYFVTYSVDNTVRLFNEDGEQVDVWYISKNNTEIFNVTKDKIFVKEVSDISTYDFYNASHPITMNEKNKKLIQDFSKNRI